MSERPADSEADPPSAPRGATDRGRLREAPVWIFDLDNTLYPARCNLFDQVDRRMGRFISQALGVSHDEARRLQKDYFREYGTTLSGLMDRHGVDPHDFLTFVHDIDYSPIARDARLDATLDALAGRKVIFTNGTVAHAEAVTRRLGVDRHFDAIFDITAADFVPKPRAEPYRRLIDDHDIVPAEAVMVEDIAQNLAIPAEMGMATVWVRTDHAWSRPGVADSPDQPPAPYIDHVTDDLAAFLDWVLAAEESPE